MTDNVYCTAPWNGITIREDGAVRTCCVGGVSLGNLNHTPITEIIKSPALKEIQEVIKNGQPHRQNCQQCVSGKSLMKDYYNQLSIDNFSDLSLKVVDVRWSNLCNLKCMYCSPTFSSVWQSESRSSTKTITVKSYQDDVAEWIMNKVDNLHELMLVGGEPLLMKQNYQLIARLSNEVNLSIITNLSYDLRNLPCIDDLLRRPKAHTKWNVSLDNVDQQFEYVRNLSSWSKVQENLVFVNDHWPETISINFVYSMFSAFDIENTFKKLHTLGIKKFNLFPVIGQDQINVFNMPLAIKQVAVENLKRAVEFHRNQIHPDDIELYPIAGVDQIFNSLMINNARNISKKQFYEKMQWYNRHSKYKFEDLWPHVMELVDLHLQ